MIRVNTCNCFALMTLPTCICMRCDRKKKSKRQNDSSDESEPEEQVVWMEKKSKFFSQQIVRSFSP